MYTLIANNTYFANKKQQKLKLVTWTSEKNQNSHQLPGTNVANKGDDIDNDQRMKAHDDGKRDGPARKQQSWYHQVFLKVISFFKI